ncbi:hypothetical protein BC831DRAFT_440712, partial [Entophlyctis helioformis]
MALALQDIFICFEMPFFALAHMRAFPWTDYDDSRLSSRVTLRHAIKTPWVCAISSTTHTPRSSTRQTFAGAAGLVGIARSTESTSMPICGTKTTKSCWLTATTTTMAALCRARAGKGSSRLALPLPLLEPAQATPSTTTLTRPWQQRTGCTLHPTGKAGCTWIPMLIRLGQPSDSQTQTPKKRLTMCRRASSCLATTTFPLSTKTRGTTTRHRSSSSCSATPTRSTTKSPAKQAEHARPSSYSSLLPSKGGLAVPCHLPHRRLWLDRWIAHLVVISRVLPGQEVQPILVAGRCCLATTRMKQTRICLCLILMTTLRQDRRLPPVPCSPAREKAGAD